MATDGGETIGTSDRPRSTGRMAGRRWRALALTQPVVLQLPDPASTRIAPVPLGMGRGGLGARPVARRPVPGGGRGVVAPVDPVRYRHRGHGYPCRARRRALLPDVHALSAGDRLSGRAAEGHDGVLAADPERVG